MELGPAVDVVLPDRRMPGMSGGEVLTHVRECHTDCRVAMVTAIGPGPDIVDMPCDDYLTKPVEKQELLDMVEQFRLLDRYEEMVGEYHSVVRKCAVLESNRRASGGHSAGLAELEARRETLATRLQETIVQFADDAVADVFQQVHPAAD